MTFQDSLRYLLIVGVALALGSAAAQQSQRVDGVVTEAATIDTRKDTQSESPAEGTPAFQNRKDKLSYAFGVDLARDLQEQKNELNVNLLITALTDALADKKLLMTDEEVTATLKTFERERKQDFEHAKSMLSQKNKKAGEELFATNMKSEGIITLPSGLQYRILKLGEGKRPTLDDKVVCNYRGTLLDGKEFYSSYNKNEPATLSVKGVMKGISEALQLMPVGSKWQIFIPPQLGYGERVVGGIAPNATLIFEMELISIVEKPQAVQGIAPAGERVASR